MEDVGAKLKQEREQKNITLEEIAQTTNIKKDYLIAIENNDFAQIPTFIHAKGFVRTYANFLGLDGLEYSKKINNLETKQDDFSAKTIVASNRSFFSWAKLKDELVEQFKRYKLHLGMMLGAVVLIFCLYKITVKFISLFKGKAQQKTVQVQVPAVKLEKQLPVAKTYPAIRDEIALDIQALEDVWITAVVDGEVVYDDIMVRGGEELWVAKNKVILKIGDAGKVSLSLNDNDLGKIGENGEVIKKLVLTKKGMEIF
jgi:transcriptional regulator with XRE-family HTH domain